MQCKQGKLGDKSETFHENTATTNAAGTADSNMDKQNQHLRYTENTNNTHNMHWNRNRRAETERSSVSFVFMIIFREVHATKKQVHSTKKHNAKWSNQVIRYEWTQRYFYTTNRGIKWKVIQCLILLDALHTHCCQCKVFWNQRSESQKVMRILLRISGTKYVAYNAPKGYTWLIHGLYRSGWTSCGCMGITGWWIYEAPPWRPIWYFWFMRQSTYTFTAP